MKSMNAESGANYGNAAYRRAAPISLLLLALLIAASIPISFAQSSMTAIITGCTADTVKIIWDNAGSTIAMLLSLTILALGAIYMLATAFNRTEYVVMVKDEFFHLAISLCILLFFGAVMAVSCGLLSDSFNFAYNQLHAANPGVVDPCYIPDSQMEVRKMSSCYLKSMEKDADALVALYTRRNIELQLDASAYVSYFGLLGGTTFSPEAYKRSWAQFVDNTNNLFVIPAFVSIKMQDLLITFFVGGVDAKGSAILQFLLPAAFVLRFFPPLRQIGNMMIALAIGAYLVLPFFTALNGVMYMFVFSADDATRYGDMFNDLVLGQGLLSVARLYPQAFLLPNLMIVAFVTFIASLSKALKVLG